MSKKLTYLSALNVMNSLQVSANMLAISAAKDRSLTLNGLTSEEE